MKPGMFKTVEPRIQEEILALLPDDGVVALKIMAQLSANIILAVRGPSLADFFTATQLFHQDFVEHDS